MRRPNPNLSVAKSRVAIARKIIEDQRALVARLRSAGKPFDHEEKRLRTYESALVHLGNQERVLDEVRWAKITERSEIGRRAAEARWNKRKPLS